MTPQPRGRRAVTISGEMADLTFAYDGNFRFDVDDREWTALFHKHHLRPVRYDDMAALTEALQTSVQTVSYLPAANYFYVRDDPAYEPIASALYAGDGSPNLSSVLVVRASSNVVDVDQLAGGSLGYAHPYCTTSYFAPALVLKERGHSIADFFQDLVIVPPYEGQIDAVVAGVVDATMVQEDIWETAPNAGLTRLIARKAHLPSPVVLVDAGAGAGLKRDVTDVVLSHRPDVTPNILFTGFVPYRRGQIEEFFAASASALAGVRPTSSGRSTSGNAVH